jgi:hypothetical protein
MFSFLPVDQSSKGNYAMMLSNMNNIIIALAHSKNCEYILQQKTPLA